MKVNKWGFRADKRWLQETHSIMKQVNTAMFGKDATVAPVLLDNWDSTIGEASRDPFCGVGLLLCLREVLNRAA